MKIFDCNQSPVGNIEEDSKKRDKKNIDIRTTDSYSHVVIIIHMR